MFCEETFRDVDNRCLGCGASVTYKETNVQSVKLHFFCLFLDEVSLRPHFTRPLLPDSWIINVYRHTQLWIVQFKHVQSDFKVCVCVGIFLYWSPSYFLWQNLFAGPGTIWARLVGQPAFGIHLSPLFQH